MQAEYTGVYKIYKIIPSVKRDYPLNFLTINFVSNIIRERYGDMAKCPPARPEASRTNKVREVESRTGRVWSFAPKQEGSSGAVSEFDKKIIYGDMAKW